MVFSTLWGLDNWYRCSTVFEKKMISISELLSYYSHMTVQISGVATVIKMEVHNQGLDCFNRVFECSVRVFRFLKKIIGRAQPGPGPCLARPWLRPVENNDKQLYNDYNQHNQNIDN